MNETEFDIKLHFSEEELTHLVKENHDNWYVVEDPKTLLRGVITGKINLNKIISHWPLVAALPSFHPAYLGDITFLKTHQATYPYIVGEMANGIATAQMVINAARAGLLGFFGAAGLMPDTIEKNIVQIQQALKGEVCWGSNLIHSPNEPALEEAVVNCYLHHRVKRVSASAYMQLTPPIVHYAFKGIHSLPDGTILRDNYVLAKISRPEVALLFMQPPPAVILNKLTAEGKLTQKEASLAAHLPIAEDITVEADSGGHTDNRPAIGLFPLIKSLADKINLENHYTPSIRVGLGGGIGSPEAVTAAFSMGAAYVLTGTINQTAIESGLSAAGKEMLMQAELADVMMAAAADMFEMGVKLQVLKRGTLFGSRANHLYLLYKTYNSIQDIPQDILAKLEKDIFQQSTTLIWDETQKYFMNRDPSQVEKAQNDPKYQMALIFRWYLGQSSRWAISGNNARRSDYQIWCGPCIGSFNDWIKGSFLQDLAQRNVVDIALNLLYGASQLTRAQQLREFGIVLPKSNLRPNITKFTVTKVCHQSTSTQRPAAWQDPEDIAKESLPLKKGG